MLSTKDILRKLRELREELRLNQGQIANELGVDRTTYIRKEHGSIPITTEEWIALAAAMKHVPSYFFKSDGHDTVRQNASDSTEKNLIRLYRTLTAEEREDLLLSLYLTLKNVKRKKVKNALNELIKNKKENRTNE